MANKVSTTYGSTKEVTVVYAARDYDESHPRTDTKVEVNITEYTPTIPKDNETENISLKDGYFLNENYPKGSPKIQASHALEIPLLRGTTCPVYFPKNTPFLLFTPTTKPEEGYLIYI